MDEERELFERYELEGNTPRSWALLGIYQLIEEHEKHGTHGYAGYVCEAEHKETDMRIGVHALGQGRYEAYLADTEGNVSLLELEVGRRHPVITSETVAYEIPYWEDAIERDMRLSFERYGYSLDDVDDPDKMALWGICSFIEDAEKRGEPDGYILNMSKEHPWGSRSWRNVYHMGLRAYGDCGSQDRMYKAYYKNLEGNVSEYELVYDGQQGKAVITSEVSTNETDKPAWSRE